MQTRNFHRFETNMKHSDIIDKQKTPGTKDKQENSQTKRKEKLTGREPKNKHPQFGNEIKHSQIRGQHL